MTATSPLPLEVQQLIEACEVQAASLRYSRRVPMADSVHVIVPPGSQARDLYSWAEGLLNRRGIELDWSRQPEELITRTVADTLRLVAWWLPAEQAELLTGPAFAVRGWRPDGMSCPLCQQYQHEPCNDECPLRRVETRHRIEVPLPT